MSGQHSNLQGYPCPEGGDIVPKDVAVEQENIEVNGNRFTVTRIPTATSGSWFVVHDAFEIWAAVAIDDFSGEIVGWRNPPDKFRTGIESAIKKALPFPSRIEPAWLASILRGYYA
jgi:hypothetical protein